MSKKKDTKKAIILMIICTFLIAISQVLWKLGTNIIGDKGLIGYFNLFIIIGCITYGIAAILLILALRKGELSKVHPFLILGYVWVTLFAYLFLNETLILKEIIGLILIIGGVILINK